MVGTNIKGFSVSLHSLLSTNPPVLSKTSCFPLCWKQLSKLAAVGEECTAATLCGQLVIVNSSLAFHQFVNGKWKDISYSKGDNRYSTLFKRHTRDFFVVNSSPTSILVVGVSPEWKSTVVKEYSALQE